MREFKEEDEKNRENVRQQHKSFFAGFEEIHLQGRMESRGKEGTAGEWGFGRTVGLGRISIYSQETWSDAI